MGGKQPFKTRLIPYLHALSAGLSFILYPGGKMNINGRKILNQFYISVS